MTNQRRCKTFKTSSKKSQLKMLFLSKILRKKLVKKIKTQKKLAKLSTQLTTYLKFVKRNQENN